MTPTRRLFTSLTVKDEDGKELFSISDDLVSVCLPLQPAFVNPGFHPNLEGTKWRHELTPWYDSELDYLSRQRCDGNQFAADNLIVLLYGTFAKSAEQMQRYDLLQKSALPKFQRVFSRFVQTYGHQPLCPGVGLNPVEGLAPTQYLEQIDCKSYLGWRISLFGIT